MTAIRTASNLLTDQPLGLTKYVGVSGYFWGETMAIARVTTLTTPGNGPQPPAVVASSTKSDSNSTKTADQTVATQPAIQYILFAIGIATIGFVLGLYLQDHFHHNMTKLPVLAAGVGSFALIYIMAQAIERILVPFSWVGGGFLGGCGTASGFPSKNNLKKERQSALLEAAQAPTPPQENEAKPTASRESEKKNPAKRSAETKHSLDQYTANLTGSSFGVAAALAMVVSGYTGTFLLRTVGLTTAGWLDVLVTGLVIAGGTKPLHDLISNISSSSQNKDATASA